MSQKLSMVSNLFFETQSDITDSVNNWQDFLTTASRLPKYSFSDQLLIFTQRPDATACANMELWNNKMNRWIKSGSKGIALIRQNTGQKPRLEYVFDLSDTRQLENGKTPYLWAMREEFHTPVTERLSELYGEIPTTIDFATTLMEYCARATGENYREFLHDLNYDLEDSFLEGFDELNVDVAFRNVITVSTQYMVLKRCGFDPKNYLDEEDFRSIFEFNTPSVLSHLGNALNRVSGEILLTIGDVARNIELENSRNSLENRVNLPYTSHKEKFSVINTNNIEEEHSDDKHINLQTKWGLSTPKPSNAGGQLATDSGQIRTFEGNSLENPQERNLHEDVDAGHTLGAFGGDRPNSTEPSGRIDGTDDDSTRHNRESESGKSDALGAEGYGHQSSGGGSRFEGTDLQLEPPLFPTVTQQIENIIESKTAAAATVFSFYDSEPIPSHVIDKIIAAGSNERIDTPLIAGYMAFNDDISENARYLQSHYYIGGKGFEIDENKYSLWYDSTGLQIGRGNSAHRASSKIHLTWEQVASHIKGLLENGEYLPADELKTSKNVYLTDVATAFSYMYRDKQDGYSNEILDTVMTKYVYPDCVNEIKSHLTDKEKLANVFLGLEQMAQVHNSTDGGIMRFRFYNPEKTLRQIRTLDKEPLEFPENPNFKRTEPSFITEDELNKIYTSSKDIRTTNIDIYAFFKQGHSEKDKADFLKHAHGWSGHGVSNVNVTHSAKGTTYTKGDLSHPYAEVSENWGQISKRIGRLIAEDRYLNQKELDFIPTYEKQLLAREIYSFYSYAPKDAEKPYSATEQGYSFDYGNYEKALAEITAQLDDTQFVSDLAVKMEDILSHTLSDERGFESMEKALSSVKAFQNGSYSIFNKAEYKAPAREIDDDDFDEPEETSIEQMAKKLERKRQTPFKQNDHGQLSLDFSPPSTSNDVSDILEENGLMVSDELIDFAKESLENPTPSEIAQRVEEIIAEDEKAIGSGKADFSHSPPVAEEIAESTPTPTFDKEEKLIQGENSVLEYISLKAENPNHVIGVAAGELLLFYGEDAKLVAPVLGSELLERSLPELGTTHLTGDKVDNWRSVAGKLRTNGISFKLLGEDGGEYHLIKEHNAADYLPIGMELDINGRNFVIDRVDYEFNKVSLRDVTFQNGTGYPIFRSETVEFVRSFVAEKQEKEFEIADIKPLGEQPTKAFSDTVDYDFDGGSAENNTLFAPVFETLKQTIVTDNSPKINYSISDDTLGIGSAKEKFNRNLAAIETLQLIENEQRLATPQEQEILSQYVGWGGMPEAFDDSKTAWAAEYTQLKGLLSEDEYKSARASTLNAHYTAPVVIRSMYEALNAMGIPQDGNFIDPALGTGHFVGMLPENLKDCKMYGTELDSLTGRIAKQLYPKADIQIKGFEKTTYPDNFFDVAVGNVPFGNYKLNDKRYDKQNFLIHDYFFAKTLDKVRVGGVVAFITSKGTLDKQSSDVRKYLAQKADLLGAIRLPNTAFKANAGTEVTSDIIFLQKRDHAPEVLPSWVNVAENADGITMNQYFIDNPQMIMGTMEMVSGPFGMESTCTPNTETTLAEQLKVANSFILPPDKELLNQKSHSEETDKDTSIAATPDVRNFSYTIIYDKVYYRENSRMNPVSVSDTAFDRLKALIGIRDKTRDIIEMQLAECSDDKLQAAQADLNSLYDSYNKKFGLINSKGSKSAFVNDVSYPLLCSLEKLDEEGNLAGKADMFTKRTIKQAVKITSVDTPTEALAVSISEKACVDIPFMAQLLGGAEKANVVIDELRGVIFKDPLSDSEEKYSGYQTADEYLSGNVREKLAIATLAAETNPNYAINVEMLTKVQPKELSASEIDVRIGATWIDPQYYKQFMFELLSTPKYLQWDKVDVKYSKYTGEWNVTGKSEDRANPKSYATYGTNRKNAYAIIEDSLNLRDTRIFDTVIDDDGKEKRVLNGKETTLAQQKQEAISESFKEWIWKDPERREVLAKEYNKIYNSTRPREFDGQHIKFEGMNPTICLNPHQRNAVARTLYGGNTLLAHCVGAGKTYTMISSAMESKRLGLAQKSLFVVPNHLTEQMGSDIYELYPGAKVLVATKKDFEPANRKEFCSRIATGDFDIVVIGHSQFEKIPLSVARQEAIFEKQIEEIMYAIQDAKAQNGERYTIKQLEKTQKALETRLEKLSSQEKKDSVVTFEELGVDKLYVDEAHMFKNLFLQTKMRNVAGIGQSEAQKSTDMFTKCQYMDELTGGKGTIFATGTPVSNSMVELYTMMRYLQYNTLERLDLIHFDSWAANFGEKVTAIELAPEGTGFRAKTRFAKFFNLPELINIWKEASDIQTADMLDLEVPTAEHITVVTKPSEFQVDMVKDLADRANIVRKREVEPNIDNMLRITSDGRKLALDQRLHNDMLPDNPDSKINKCVENVMQIWEETAPTKGTQLIFCDLSTPHNDGTFNVYDDIKNKLMEKGVPANEIAFIHDANTETQKAELFAKVRKGGVRVLLGSTQKMGAGTNVQTKLVALHHTDCPWRPADLEQREGRIVRQKNENKHVKIFKYVTENTFDAYNWSLIENKQRFIGQIFTSKSPVRSADDVDATALSYAEVKALATGDVRIKEKMDLDIQVTKLKLMRSSHNSQRYEMEDRVIKYYPTEMKKTSERIEGLKADYAIVESHPVGEDNFYMTVQGTHFTDKKLAGEAIIETCKQMKNPDDKIALGEYRGFPMTLSIDNGKFIVSMKNAVTHTAELENNITGNITRINNALEAMPKNIENLSERLGRLGEEMNSAKLEAERPFPKEGEYQEKSKRLAELNILLDNSEREEPSEEKTESSEKSDVSETKERTSVLQALKTLKAEETDNDKATPAKQIEER